jgi:XTP/dITP diphosphohydrolase
LQKENNESEGNFTFRGKFVFLATGNINKFKEARETLEEYGIAIGMIRVKSLEIQNDSIEEIASASVKHAFEHCHLPIIVEDTGLFVDSLNGFPGPYTSYVYRTIGNAGLLKLMANVENRKAHFLSVIAYLDEELPKPICFTGRVDGSITTQEPRNFGRPSFGFDPIFKPLNNEKTFAEMSIQDKNKVSHRAIALRKFAVYYKKADR